MNSLTFLARGKPIGQPRARATRRGNHAGVYDPGTADGWKTIVRNAAKEELQISSSSRESPIFSGPVHVEIQAFFPRPQKHFKKDVLRLDSPVYHTAKPDGDNVAKAILDALGADELQLWRDDAQVASLVVRKHFTAQSQAAGAVITIRSLEETH